MSAAVDRLRPGLPALHPWFGQRIRTLARSRPTLHGTLAWAAALACGTALPIATGGSPAAVAAALLRLVAAWPGASAIVIALAIESVASRRLSLLAQELRTGWFAALPISSGRIRLALCIVAFGYVLAGLGAWTVLAVAAWFDPGRSVPGSLLPYAIGLVAGIGVALWRCLRPAPADRLRAAGRREPLFDRALARTSPLAGIGQWQRRAVVQRWRQGQGGHFWLVGAMLVLLPDRIGATLAAGKLLMVVPWLWSSLALRTGLDTAVQASRLLCATPVQARRVLATAMHYPLFAFACAAAMASLGNLVLGFSWMRLLCWMLALALACLPAAWRLRHAAGRAGR
ncbi:MAG TPA: hypothetical protein VGD42_05770 [Lysobacter sp.]